jgi:Holliday junction DNA helicase RuvA
MIATLTGTITEKDVSQIVVECGGVGYGVLMSLDDSNTLIVGSDAKLFIYEHIKEDAHTLIGFTAVAAKKVFQQLLGVKNVGPKVALSILDIGQLGAIQAAIAEGDVKFLQSAKGVGKRAAEQIVVELRDKMNVPVGDKAEGLVYRSGVNLKDEALQALVSLGYSEGDASVALAEIDQSLSVEERVKTALKR